MRRYGGLLAGAVLIAAGAAWLLRSGPNGKGQATPPAPRVTMPAWLPPPAVAAGSAPAVVTPHALVVEVTRDGHAVPHASVRLRRGGASLGEGITDAAGSASFHLTPGEVSVVAQSGGAFARTAVTLSPLVGDTRVRLALEATGNIEVSLTDGATGRPLPGASVEVHVSCVEPRLVIDELRTGDDGRAVATGLRPIKYLVSVAHEGFRSGHCYFAKVGEPVALTLQPDKLLAGRVLLPDGGPAVGAAVSCMSSGWGEVPVAMTGPDGTFLLPSAPSPQICARLGDLVAAGDPEQAADAGLVLAAIGTLEGLVLNAGDDAPLDGVRVQAKAGGIESSAVTGPDGRFSLPGVCGESPYATFQRAGFVPEGELLEREAPVTVRLEAPGAVRGWVVDDEGRAVPGARVEVDEPIAVTTADGDGRFGFEGVKRQVFLSATEGERGGKAEAEVAPGQLVEVMIDVGPPLFRVPVEVWVDGKLSDERWQVAVSRTDGRKFETIIRWYARGLSVDVMYPTSVVLPEGSFHAVAKRDAAHGEANFRVLAGAQSALRIFATEEAPIVKPTRPLRVQVVNARGEPAVDAGVHCIAREWRFVRTGEDGRSVCTMPEANGLPSEVRSRSGGSVGSATPADWADEVVVRLRPGMRIRARVPGDAGTPRFIEVSSSDEVERHAFDGAELVLEDRPAVPTSLCLWVAGARQGCAQVEPVSGGEVTALIPVNEPGTVKFSVVDSRGQPVAEPIPYVDGIQETRTMLGEAVILSMPPGKHVLSISVPRSAERYETVLSVEPGRMHDLGRLVVK